MTYGLSYVTYLAIAAKSIQLGLFSFWACARKSKPCLHFANTPARANRNANIMRHVQCATIQLSNTNKYEYPYTAINEGCSSKSVKCKLSVSAQGMADYCLFLPLNSELFLPNSFEDT